MYVFKAVWSLDGPDAVEGTGSLARSSLRLLSDKLATGLTLLCSKTNIWY